MGIFVLIILASLLTVFLKNKKENIVEVKTEVSPYLNSNIKIKTFQTGDTWGYDISIDGTLYIHQPTIPSLPGDKGFKTEADAKKVAELVITKIRQNIMPPGVTPEELKDLSIVE